MLVYGEVHDWEGDSNVKQILVFSCSKAKHFFDIQYNKRLRESNKFNASLDTNCGAIFKLRAVKNSIGSYDSVIRCGITGHLIHQGHFDYDNFEDAIQMAKNELKRLILEL